MFGLGGQEILVVLFVAFIALGPKRLPEVGRAIGEATRAAADAFGDMRRALEREVSR